MIDVKVISASEFRKLPKNDSGVRSQPLLIPYKWTNCRKPSGLVELKHPEPSVAGGVKTTYFEATRFGKWLRFRRMETPKRNMVCWSREASL